jgi:hypothetical protein
LSGDSLKKCKEMAGIAHGIYIMDLEKYEKSKR